MSKKRHRAKQAITVFKNAQVGIRGLKSTVAKHGNSDATFLKELAKYTELAVSTGEKLRPLEDKNRQLKKMVTEQALDIQARKAITEKHWYRSKRNKPRPSG